MPPALADLLARLTAHPAVRRAGWLLFLSWVTALTLTGYLFGFTEGFFGRWCSATLVLWLLAAGTWFGIRPLIGWATQRFGAGGGAGRDAGSGGSSRSGAAEKPPRRAAPAKRAAGKPGSTPPPPPISANKWR